MEEIIGHTGHLTWNDRLTIEKMLKKGYSKPQIARYIGVHHSTIYDEVKRGMCKQITSEYEFVERYSPETAERKYRQNLREKGPDIKIGHDHALAAFLEKKIANDGYSPSAACALIGTCKKYTFSTTLCRATVYKYIDKGFLGCLTNKDLPAKGTRKRKYNHVKAAKAPRGESIERRPPHIDERAEIGHWEMDSVMGKQGTKKALVVLTERATRYEIILPVPDHTAASVVSCVDWLERRVGTYKFPKIFKSITVDNGTEFSDCEGIERSCKRRGKRRTQLFYCHPYSSWERGSNEKQNQMIRRHLPKGTNFNKIPNSKIWYVMDWLNNYPRLILGWKTSAQLFEEYLSSVA